jgi:uncharacterized membrane protein
MWIDKVINVLIALMVICFISGATGMFLNKPSFVALCCLGAVLIMFTAEFFFKVKERGYGKRKN